MSGTMRHDVGRTVCDHLNAVEPGIIEAIGGRGASRWAGVARHRYECITFSFKVPRDFAKAWRLLRLVSRCQTKYAKNGVSGVATNGCHILAQKLTVSLGLPVDVVSGDEASFITSIDDAPGDLSVWCGYADWLRERDDAKQQWRGNYIGLLLDKKAIKFTNGVPREEWSDETAWNHRHKVPKYTSVPRRDLLGESVIVPDIFEGL